MAYTPPSPAHLLQWLPDESPEARQKFPKYTSTKAYEAYVQGLAVAAAAAAGTAGLSGATSGSLPYPSHCTNDTCVHHAMSAAFALCSAPMHPRFKAFCDSEERRKGWREGLGGALAPLPLPLKPHLTEVGLSLMVECRGGGGGREGGGSGGGWGSGVPPQPPPPPPPIEDGGRLVVGPRLVGMGSPNNAGKARMALSSPLPLRSAGPSSNRPFFSPQGGAGGAGAGGESGGVTTTTNTTNIPKVLFN